MDDWGLKFWEGFVKFLPAIGGAIISLKYLPKEDRTFWGILSALITGIILAVYAGAWIVSYFVMSNESAEANGVLILGGIFGVIILDKVVTAIKDIRARDVKEWILGALRKWIN